MLEYMNELPYPKWSLFASRRATVHEIYKTRGIPQKRERAILAIFFNVSESAIYQDFLHFLHGDRSEKLYPTVKEKTDIYKRDGNVCCYCGSEKSQFYVIEHVIPVSRGGICAPYNLVVACWSCNVKKKSKVWIPCNLETITENHPHWKDKVVLLTGDC